MYFINDISELNEAKVSQILNLYNIHELPVLERYKKYFDGEQNADLVVNFCYNIVQNYAGYLTGIPIAYSSDEDISDLLEILKVNDYHREDNDLLQNALVYGVSYELLYLDEQAEIKFSCLDSRECIPIYSNDINQELLAVIRIYDANEYINGLSTLKSVKKFCDVYTKEKILHYESVNTSLKYLSEEFHYFGKVPITVFELNNDRRAIFHQIMGLQDQYNMLIKANIDDYSAFVDAYMVIKGLTADEETLEEAKKNRALLLPDDSADISYLTKPDNSTGIRDLLDRIETKIERIAQSPDFADEAFGTSSGIAIRYKLTGMENVCSNIETNMRQALQRRLELIYSIESLKAYEFTWRGVDIIFTRNIPVNHLENAQFVNMLRGLVSDRTLLAQLPFISDVDKELELLEEQNAEVMTYEFE